MSDEKNQRVIRFYAAFVMPEDPKFFDEAMECRVLLQMVQSFQGKCWEAQFPKKELKILEPEESLLTRIEIPRSLPPEAKVQLRHSIRAPQLDSKKQFSEISIGSVLEKKNAHDSFGYRT